MNFLYLFVLVPLVMMGVIALTRGENTKMIKGVMAAGSSLQLILSFVLLYLFVTMRSNGMDDDMLFRSDLQWFPSLNIELGFGVDGISVLMIVLSAIIVFTGTFTSWSMSDKVKEYFLWFLMLSIGVFGFFITVDLFAMFMFYEVALIPMYLLIGVWGTGRKSIVP